ncbi:MAG TPA: ferrochelatase [Candidatus Binatia bacterium]|nr:ferrochelatase [Candidatus Binatia bacterium]
MTARCGVLLLTFGSAVTADEVPAYLRSLRGGTDPDPTLIVEFQRRFRIIGRSPLIEITEAQARDLQRLLDERHGAGRYTVGVGMQHSEPRIAGAIDRMAADGVSPILAIVLAPQYSPLVLAGYERAVDSARSRHPGLEIAVARAWHTIPGWIESLCQRLSEALVDAGSDPLRPVPVVFTAHSLPRSVIDRDPGYLEQLHETVSAVVDRLGLQEGSWRFAWQSAGHTPAEWLKPDLLDVLPDLAAAGASEVLVAPVQFVADHLETLYDIDVAAREQAEEHGLRFHRIAMPNSSPAFVRGLAEVVERELAGAATAWPGSETRDRGARVKTR